MIERVHLEIIRTLDDTGTLTGAADRMHLTQSALSHAIRRLEERAGATVWRKEGRRLVLTEAGRHLLEVANRLLPQLEEADALLAGYADGTRGNLRIGMECHPCYEWLLGVLPGYLAANPGIDVDVIQRFQFSGGEALERHDIDLLITPDPIRRDGIAYRAILPYELRLIAAETIRVAESPAAACVEAAALADLDLLTYPVPRDRLDIFIRLLIPAGVEPRSVRTVEATEVMLELVRAGRGVTALPDWMVHRLGPGVRDYRLGPDGIAKELRAGYRVQDEGLPFIRSFFAGIERSARGIRAH